MRIVGFEKKKTLNRKMRMCEYLCIVFVAGSIKISTLQSELYNLIVFQTYLWLSSRLCKLSQNFGVSWICFDTDAGISVSELWFNRIVFSCKKSCNCLFDGISVKLLLFRDSSGDSGVTLLPMFFVAYKMLINRCSKKKKRMNCCARKKNNNKGR